MRNVLDDEVGGATMDTYELSFEVEHDPEDQYDVLMVELDATVSLHHGLVVVALSVDAESATDAARSGLKQLGSAPSLVDT